MIDDLSRLIADTPMVLEVHMKGDHLRLFNPETNISVNYWPRSKRRTIHARWTNPDYNGEVSFIDRTTSGSPERFVELAINLTSENILDEE